MTHKDKLSFQNITIVKVAKSAGETPPKTSDNRLFHITIAILGTLVVLGIGYAAGVRAGYFSAPQYLCCFGVLELNLDLEL